MTAAELMTTGELIGVESGEAVVEMVALEGRGRGVLLTLGNEDGGEVELLLTSRAARDIALALLTFAHEVEDFNAGFLPDGGTEFEYEPNREALAMEARAEPEGRWGDE